MKLSSLSIVLPVYNDEKSVGQIIKKAVYQLPKIARSYDIIVVNDGSKDNTLSNLLKLKKEIKYLKVINHNKNLGYGAALSTGFKAAKKDFIFYTDGDGQYDISELKNLIALMDLETDVVTGFKIKRSDQLHRKIIGFLYNRINKFVFNLKVKDIDCDFRIIRKHILENIDFKIKSGAFDVFLIKKLQERKARIKEIPVNHYPRVYGNSQFFRFEKIIKTFFDLFYIKFLS